jgi:hypothetical protein
MTASRGFSQLLPAFEQRQELNAAVPNKRWLACRRRPNCLKSVRKAYSAELSKVKAESKDLFACLDWLDRALMGKSKALFRDMGLGDLIGSEQFCPRWRQGAA